MNEDAMKVIAEVIALVLKIRRIEEVLDKARGMVRDLTAQYPLYPTMTY